MKNVLAITTCFNRKEKTTKAINSLISGNDNLLFDFLICDDNSTDGTYDELKKINNVVVIKGDGKLYWCGGMRKAIDYALKTEKEYDYCLLFNDDVDFYDNSIEKLVSNNQYCVLVGPTCNNEGSLTYGGIIKLSNVRPKFKTIMGKDNGYCKCDTFNANCIIIPWNIFKTVGNMDSHYIHSIGDFDYGFKISKYGYDIFVSNEYVGICNKNEIKNTWEDNSLSIKDRIKLKESLKGLPFKQWFYFLNKNYNFLTAIFYSISPYIKILFKEKT